MEAIWYADLNRFAGDVDASWAAWGRLSSLLEASCGVLEPSQGVVEASLVVLESSKRRFGVSCRFFKRVGSALAASWRLLGASLAAFLESGKRLGRDITLSVYFEEVRSQFRGRFVLILEVKTERS